MSLACVKARASLGLDAPGVRVEVHLSPGLPGLTIVGLPETGVRESKDRVRSALLNSGLTFPQQRITINLAPADLPKEGGRFDLAIALGILAASGQIPPARLDTLCCLGELALSGELRPVSGVLSASLASRAAQETLVVPSANAAEATLPPGTAVFTASSLTEVVVCLRRPGALPLASPGELTTSPASGPDLSSVRGQHHARRALEIAAAGAHSLLLHGPPGTGKTLLASCLPGLLPPLDLQAQLEVTAIHSLAGSSRSLNATPPCRAPHHRTGSTALIGGGSSLPRPGEISLAHAGVLFLDELPEFGRQALESLREPLESGEVVISRARRQVRFPARCLLVAAMNACPCGRHGLPDGGCRCTPEQLARYQGRISGPLLDRMDLRAAVGPVPLVELQKPEAGAESSAQVRERVIRARMRQLQRQGRENARADGQQLAAALDLPTQTFLRRAGERMQLSARAYHRVLRIARSIADLAGDDAVGVAAVAEALGFRGLPGD